VGRIRVTSEVSLQMRKAIIFHEFKQTPLYLVVFLFGLQKARTPKKGC
uniref:Phosphoribulokinase/uridine kinase domain-containing protein n=1 Tax=Parascaris univalens TaxID=6257 RepID=A0A915C1V0_PARUN